MDLRLAAERWRRCWGGTALCLVLMVVMVAVTGCASGGTRTDGESSRRDVLTRAQILEAEASNLYEVVRRLRPEWLRTKGAGGTDVSRKTRVVVVHNGAVVGGVRSLREFSPQGVRRLRYTEAETAAATLVGGDPGFIEGAIIVELGG